MQSPLRFLAIGDSLTAGFCDYGLTNHPYSKNLFNSFSSSKIAVIVDQKGISGEHVVPSMVKRLENILVKSDYDWVIILGGTNDLAYRKSGEQIFSEGLKLMYDMVLQHTNQKMKLAVMTIIENGYYPPEDIHDQQRQILNKMIKNYVENCKDQDRICLVDLDKYIPYHSIKDINQRNIIWDDFIHLTPNGYDQMAYFIFQEISKKIQNEFNK
jgi:lysophospholipase L1-like esterase